MEEESLLPQQLYKTTPTVLKEVHGASSKAIFSVMMNLPKNKTDYPRDVDDWERNRALLICYPEWKLRLKEMRSVSKCWEVLINNWEIIEEKYLEDYEKYGDNAYDKGECNKYIRNLIKLVEPERKLNFRLW